MALFWNSSENYRVDFWWGTFIYLSIYIQRENIKHTIAILHIPLSLLCYSYIHIVFVYDIPYWYIIYSIGRF